MFRVAILNTEINATTFYCCLIHATLERRKEQFFRKTALYKHKLWICGRLNGFLALLPYGQIVQNSTSLTPNLPTLKTYRPTIPQLQTIIFLFFLFNGSRCTPNKMKSPTAPVCYIPHRGFMGSIV
ncbi:hypothetical protein EDD65_1252 [Keratinibaculum paraultunense]|uniref:Uncharacterized protein n=1 Tax=Keratinibaculum paraultunense TaxID=1278232 RepID=A0A4R3KM18_9FIRM|nr:hypothetical protein EDD65_1252 [Keratinibaculum paraultunense]